MYTYFTISTFYTGNFTFSSKLRNAELFLFSTTRYVIINYTKFFGVCVGVLVSFPFLFFFSRRVVTL